MKLRPLMGATIVLCAILSLSACASVSSKFVPQTKENVSAFADTTLTMLTSLEFGFTRDESIYIRDFFNAEGAEEKQLMANNQAINKAYKSIVRYSLQLVIIAETHDQEGERVAAYADFLSKADPNLLEERGFDKQYYFDLVEQIKSREKFLDALKTAQPIVSAMTHYVNSVLEEKHSQIESLSVKLETRIDNRYAEVIRFQQTLEAEKYAILRALENLYLTYSGKPEAFEELVASGVFQDKKLIPNDKPSDADLIKMAKHLEARLKTMHLIGEEIKPDWDNYRATHRELDTLHAAAIDRLNKARLLSLVWLRAHQKMASGVVSPAEWFNIKDLPSELIGMGTKAIF